MSKITVVGNAPFPDIPYGRAVTVEHTRRIDGLLASGRISRVDDAATDDVPALMGDVQEWVDGDPDRARTALAVEQARSQGPRSTLAPWLEDVIAPPAAHVDVSEENDDPRHDHTGGDAGTLTGDPTALG